jgi:hypothetical protein
MLTDAMSDDLRKALEKSGLASQKKLRQAKHQDRVRRKQLGEEGLEAERAQREQDHRAEQAARRNADRARERTRQAQQAEAARAAKITHLLQEANLLPREAGPRRFYFETPAGTIPFVEVSEALARRLIQGDAAIADAAGILPAGFAVISGKAAAELAALEKPRLLHWNVRA